MKWKDDNILCRLWSLACGIDAQVASVVDGVFNTSPAGYKFGTIRCCFSSSLLLGIRVDRGLIIKV